MFYGLNAAARAAAEAKFNAESLVPVEPGLWRAWIKGEPAERVLRVESRVCIAYDFDGNALPARERLVVVGDDGQIIDGILRVALPREWRGRAAA